MKSSGAASITDNASFWEHLKSCKVALGPMVDIYLPAPLRRAGIKSVIINNTLLLGPVNQIEHNYRSPKSKEELLMRMFWTWTLVFFIRGPSLLMWSIFHNAERLTWPSISSMKNEANGKPINDFNMSFVTDCLTKKKKRHFCKKLKRQNNKIALFTINNECLTMALPAFICKQNKHKILNMRFHNHCKPLFCSMHPIKMSYFIMFTYFWDAKWMAFA